MSDVHGRKPETRLKYLHIAFHLSTTTLKACQQNDSKTGRLHHFTLSSSGACRHVSHDNAFAKTTTEEDDEDVGCSEFCSLLFDRSNLCRSGCLAQSDPSRFVIEGGLLPLKIIDNESSNDFCEFVSRSPRQVL